MEDKSQNLKVTQFTYKLQEMKKQEFEIFFGHFQHISFESWWDQALIWGHNKNLSFDVKAHYNLQKISLTS
jgi:hypothetical protein